MHRLGTVVLLGLAFTVVLSGSAAGKIVVELSPHTGAPGDELQIKAGWGSPVGPIRRLRIFLLAPMERLGNGAEIADRFGVGSSRRQVLVLDAAPDGRDRLRAAFTVPQVPDGGYGVGVCVSQRECFSYGRFRVTGSVFEEYVPEARGAGDSPRETGSSAALDRAGSSLVTATRVAAAVALMVALGCAALALRRVAARRAAMWTPPESASGVRAEVMRAT